MGLVIAREYMQTPRCEGAGTECFSHELAGAGMCLIVVPCESVGLSALGCDRAGQRVHSRSLPWV